MNIMVITIIDFCIVAYQIDVWKKWCLASVVAILNSISDKIEIHFTGNDATVVRSHI